jgi:hypothetical protein
VKTQDVGLLMHKALHTYFYLQNGCTISYFHQHSLGVAAAPPVPLFELIGLFISANRVVCGDVSLWA